MGSVLSPSAEEEEFLAAFKNSDWNCLASQRQWEYDRDIWEARFLHCPVTDKTIALMYWFPFALFAEEFVAREQVEVHSRDAAAVAVKWVPCELPLGRATVREERE